MKLSAAEARGLAKKLGIAVPKGQRVAKVDHAPAVHGLCRILSIPLPEPEVRFMAPDRQYRLDFGWRQERIGLELEGGIWTNGAHVRGKHFESDCVKYSLAAILGWKVLRITPEMLNDGRALDLLGRAFGRVV